MRYTKRVKIERNCPGNYGDQKVKVEKNCINCGRSISCARKDNGSCWCGEWISTKSFIRSCARKDTLTVSERDFLERIANDMIGEE